MIALEFTTNLNLQVSVRANIVEDKDDAESAVMFLHRVEMCDTRVNGEPTIDVDDKLREQLEKQAMVILHSSSEKMEEVY